MTPQQSTAFLDQLNQRIDRISEQQARYRLEDIRAELVSEDGLGKIETLEDLRLVIEDASVKSQYNYIGNEHSSRTEGDIAFFMVDADKYLRPADPVNKATMDIVDVFIQRAKETYTPHTASKTDNYRRRAVLEFVKQAAPQLRADSTNFHDIIRQAAEAAYAEHNLHPDSPIKNGDRSALVVIFAELKQRDNFLNLLDRQVQVNNDDTIASALSTVRDGLAKAVKITPAEISRVVNSALPTDQRRNAQSLALTLWRDATPKIRISGQ